MLIEKKGAISMKNHQFFSFWPKQMMFLNKNKGAISKIAPKMLLERGRRYLNIINSAFLLFSCAERFRTDFVYDFNPSKLTIAYNKATIVST